MGDKEGEALAESPCRYLHKPSTHGMCQHRRQEPHLPDSPVIRVTCLVLSLLPSPPPEVRVQGGSAVWDDVFGL